jgi:hypothetical protein
MNPNWTRWIHASISDYFKDYGRRIGLSIQVEGQDKPKRPEDWVELRWDGPLANETTRNNWILELDINCLISSVLGRKDVHKHKRIVGEIQSVMPKDFPIYRFGDDPIIDTQDLLGCMTLRPDNREGIITSYFGQIDVDVLLEQSSVEAHYRMHLRTEG